MLLVLFLLLVLVAIAAGSMIRSRTAGMASVSTIVFPIAPPAPRPAVPTVPSAASVAPVMTAEGSDRSGPVLGRAAMPMRHDHHTTMLAGRTAAGRHGKPRKAPRRKSSDRTDPPRAMAAIVPSHDAVREEMTVEQVRERRDRLEALDAIRSLRFGR